MEYAAFLWLRVTQPDCTCRGACPKRRSHSEWLTPPSSFFVVVHRPYRVPISTFAFMLLIFPAMFFLVLVLVLANYAAILVCFTTFCVSTIIYVMKNRCDQNSQDG